MKVGDLSACSDCGGIGVIVCTDIMGSDFDAKLQLKSGRPLEPSGYAPPGLTCRTCETERFKTALPPRGICSACGRPNAKAIKQDLGASRSFCGDACINDFVNGRLHGP